MVRWRVRWGADEAFLERLAAEEGVPPGALAERPALFPALAPYWRAFLDLAGDRPGDDRPLPWAVIDAYAARLGIADEDEFRIFHALVRACDGAFLDERAEARGAASARPPWITPR